MKFRNLGLIALLSLGSTVLTGCVFDVRDNDLLAKPRLPVELEEINSVLRNHFDTDLRLVTPTEGQYQKSIQFVDLDEDASDEVVVLHSKESDQFAMKVTVLSKKDDKWRINTDIQGIGYDVNRIDYPDLDGDGVKEIVVGWQSGALLNKGISIYQHGEEGYTEIFKDSYTAYVTGNITNQGRDELLLIKLNRSEGYSKYILYTMVDHQVKGISETFGDGYVSDYPNILVGQIAPGVNGVVIDAKVGAISGFTDLLYFDGNRLVNPFFKQRSQSTEKTFRQAERQSTDIDGDGIIEIPLVYKGVGPSGVKTAPLITQWNKWDLQTGLLETIRSYDDLNQGFRILLPMAWNEGIVVAAEQEGLQIMTEGDGVDNPSVLLCHIRIFERKNYEATRKEFEGKGYIELGRTLDKVFLGKVGAPTGEADQLFKITNQQLKELFRVL